MTFPLPNAVLCHATTVGMADPANTRKGANLGIISAVRTEFGYVVCEMDELDLRA